MKAFPGETQCYTFGTMELEVYYMICLSSYNTLKCKDFSIKTLYLYQCFPNILPMESFGCV
jgi:hypothetical protein